MGRLCLYHRSGQLSNWMNSIFISDCCCYAVLLLESENLFDSRVQWHGGNTARSKYLASGVWQVARPPRKFATSAWKEVVLRNQTLEDLTLDENITTKTNFVDTSECHNSILLYGMFRIGRLPSPGKKRGWHHIYKSAGSGYIWNWELQCIVK